jgi:hypothetical protein
MLDFMEISLAVIGISIIGFCGLFTLAIFGVVGAILLATFPILFFAFFA